jgi:pseudaminic acid cytidylyltransferase
MKIAVIPARGGSKRIPRKNIKPFAGRPMLAYAVSAALEAGLFSTVVVSSDDSEILEYASTLGATPLRRPQALADDWTPTVPVVAHAIAATQEDFGQPDIVCCIYPAVPFLQRQDMVETLSLLEGTNGKYAFPVVRFPSPIQRALRLGQEGVLAPFFPEATDARSQDLEPGYYDAGQFYWGWRDAWLSEAPVHSNGHGFVIPEWRAVDIDTPDDWRRAELMYAALAKQGDTD